ncbi:MAG TPA: NAD(P)-dependent alcohol dehydrogenase [Gaiellaceae bacterium]|nr:NAD(P)-dependent alcohol dehydrogenase [Gaiellaceae bacterium]
MKAAVHERYGPPEVLRIAELQRPAPAADELLVRVHASSVTRGDCGLRNLEYPFSRLFTGLRRPRRTVAGTEFAGVVEEVGSAVRSFRPGDEVFGIRSGANAEYVCVRESGIVARKPEGVSFEEAAAVADGALVAKTCLAGVDLGPGRRILVYGASGSIGTAAVQLARHHFGAHVTAVCNTRNVELVRSLGADEVVDYEREDFTRRGETYDVVFDAVGKHSFRRSRRVLAPGGVYLSADLGYLWHGPLVVLATRWIGSRKAKLGIGRYLREDLLLLQELLETGRYRAVVDRVYALADVVEAARYVETGQKTGSVVLSIVPAAIQAAT